MFVISFNIYLFIYFSVKYAIQSNDCDVFLNKQSILFHSILYLHARIRPSIQPARRLVHLKCYCDQNFTFPVLSSALESIEGTQVLPMTNFKL